MDTTLTKVDFYCAVDIHQNQFPVSVRSEIQNGVTVFFIEEDKVSPDGRSLQINEIQRIHIGDSTKDFDYCSKQYQLLSVISNNTNEIRLRVKKVKGSGATKELDITVSSEYGEDIVRINIDDDADNKTT